MTAATLSTEEQKRAAALSAVELIEDGTVIGLGTGSTAFYLIQEVGRRLEVGQMRGISAVATSLATERLARSLDIPLVDLPPEGVAVAIDGMDEVDDGLRAIKGLGGALSREKIVAASARLFVLVGDERKRVRQLAEACPVPVEVLEFGWRRTGAALEELGLQPALRRNRGEVFRTDNGNPVLDCRIQLPMDLERLADDIALVPGVLEHGLFLDYAGIAFIAGDNGVQEMKKPR